MNIIQAYTKFNEQYIILISGFSGSGKSHLAKFFAKLFRFESMNLNDYLIKDYDKQENYVKLKDGTGVLDWDNVWKSVDWNKFNNHVNEKKKNGIIVRGFGFPSKLLDFKPDIHIHIKINKKKLLENREKYMESHLAQSKDQEAKDQEQDQDKNQDQDQKNKLILNDVTYPHYLKLMEESTIDKFLNANELSEDQIKEQGFSYIMYRTNKWLNEYNEHLNKPINKQESKQDQDKAHKIKDAWRDYGGYGANGYYDDVYFPDKHRKLYDFNDQGIDYPSEMLRQDAEVSDSSDSSDSSSDSDAQFLFTTK